MRGLNVALAVACLCVSHAANARMSTTCTRLSESQQVCTSFEIPDPLVIAPQMTRTLPQLPALPEISRSILDSLPQASLGEALGRIKDFNDLSRIQGQVLTAFPRITESVVRDFLRDKQITREAIANLNRSSMVNVLDIGARVVPLQRSTSEIVSGFNTMRAEQKLPQLNPFKNGTDADYLSVAFYKQLEYEKSVYEPYLADQIRNNRSLLNQSLENLKTVTHQMGQMSLDNQKIGVSEIAQSPSASAIRQSLRRPIGLGGELGETLQRLDTLDVATPQEVAAKDLAQKTFDASAEAFQQGDNSLGKELANLGISIADIALGFVPVVGQGRDLYESFYGRSLLTDRELTSTERSLALAGVITFGYMTSATKIEAALVKLIGKGEVLSRIATSALETVRALKPLDLLNLESLDALRRAFRRGVFVDTEAIIKDLNRNILERTEAMGIKLVDRRIGFADDLNIKYLSARPNHEIPYRPGSLFIGGTTSAKISNLVRVFQMTEGNTKIYSNWTVDKRFISDTKGSLRTSLEIKNILNLPNMPTHVVNISVPSGTKIEISELARNSFGTNEGAIQVRLRPSNQGELKQMYNLNSIEELMH